jgi:hypothetical protein
MIGLSVGGKQKQWREKDITRTIKVIRKKCVPSEQHIVWLILIVPSCSAVQPLERYSGNTCDESRVRAAEVFGRWAAMTRCGLSPPLKVF